MITSPDHELYLRIHDTLCRLICRGFKDSLGMPRIFSDKLFKEEVANLVVKILIAEDDKDTALLFKMALEKRKHEVITTPNGEDCLKVYQEALQNIRLKTDLTEHIQPFDVVVLDYKMPKINGMDVAKEILAVNPHQRIVFASAFVKETLVDSIKELKQVVELMQKPFGEGALIDTIEDKGIYSELQKLNVNVSDIKAANLRHEQIREILDILRNLQKGKTF